MLCSYLSVVDMHCEMRGKGGEREGVKEREGEEREVECGVER